VNSNETDGVTGTEHGRTTPALKETDAVTPGTAPLPYDLSASMSSSCSVGGESTFQFGTTWEKYVPKKGVSMNNSLLKLAADAKEADTAVFRTSVHAKNARGIMATVLPTTVKRTAAARYMASGTTKAEVLALEKSKAAHRALYLASHEARSAAMETSYL